MKAKRVIVGATAAAIFSASVCAAPVSLAADESTVQVTVGDVNVNPGETFTVDVTLSGIPATGIQACDFAVSYDNTIVTITDVTAGELTKTGADEADSTAQSVPLFDSEIHSDTGRVDLVWSTGLDDPTYWLNGEGVFCTLSGTVSEDAENGTYSPLRVVPVERETYPGSGVTNSDIVMGYVSGTDVYKYTAETSDGVITVGEAGESTLRGDANCDGKINVEDVVLILSYVCDYQGTAITEQGLINSDVYQTGDGISSSDAGLVAMYIAKNVDKL